MPGYQFQGYTPNFMAAARGAAGAPGSQAAMASAVPAVNPLATFDIQTLRELVQKGGDTGAVAATEIGRRMNQAAVTAAAPAPAPADIFAEATAQPGPFNISDPNTWPNTGPYPGSDPQTPVAAWQQDVGNVGVAGATPVRRPDPARDGGPVRLDPALYNRAPTDNLSAFANAASPGANAAMPMGGAADPTNMPGGASILPAAPGDYGAPAPVDPATAAEIRDKAGLFGTNFLSNKDQYSNLLAFGLALMAAAEPQAGAVRGPSLMGAIGRAGLATEKGIRGREAAATEVAQKERFKAADIAVKREDIQATKDLRKAQQDATNQLNQATVEIKRLGLQIQGTQAQAAIIDKRAQALDKIRSTPEYIGADDAKKKQLEDATTKPFDDLMTPASRAQAASTQYQEGDRARLRDGRIATFHNGKWVAP